MWDFVHLHDVVCGGTIMDAAEAYHPPVRAGVKKPAVSVPLCVTSKRIIPVLRRYAMPARYAQVLHSCVRNFARVRIMIPSIDSAVAPFSYAYASRRD